MEKEETPSFVSSSTDLFPSSRCARLLICGHEGTMLSSETGWRVAFVSRNQMGDCCLVDEPVSTSSIEMPNHVPAVREIAIMKPDLFTISCICSGLIA
jgi:hypothetical protein